jgi:hypothetical protein
MRGNETLLTIISRQTVYSPKAFKLRATTLVH